MLLVLGKRLTGWGLGEPAGLPVASGLARLLSPSYAMHRFLKIENLAWFDGDLSYSGGANM